MGIDIRKEDLEKFVIGGAILGGGGGKLIEEALKIANFAFEMGFSCILSIDELDSDSLLLTVSLVGAPSAGSEFLKPEHYIRSVELFLEKTEFKISGLISSEIGATGIVNGWLQSAYTGIPVVDAPCNGRAHLTGLMGSMGLHRDKNFVSFQTAVGGEFEKGTWIEAIFKGSLLNDARLVREASILSSGLVAVGRNPVPVGYVREFDAPNSIRMAMEIGSLFLSEERGRRIEKLREFFGKGDVLKGVVENVFLEREGGFDRGLIEIRENNSLWKINFLNEYLTLERSGKREATFPDLITVFDSSQYEPLASAKVKKGMEVIVFWTPWKGLKIGAGARDIELIKHLERVLEIEMVKYLD
ncbi:MAG: S-methyl thiohydantoin desulfurase domain-containing protein [Candidatus Aminicenantia bacterium]